MLKREKVFGDYAEQFNIGRELSEEEGKIQPGPKPSHRLIERYLFLGSRDGRRKIAGLEDRKRIAPMIKSWRSKPRRTRRIDLENIITIIEG